MVKTGDNSLTIENDYISQTSLTPRLALCQALLIIAATVVDYSNNITVVPVRKNDI